MLSAHAYRMLTGACIIGITGARGGSYRLFSATLPKLLVEFARAGLRDPTLVRLDVDTKISENLQMQFFAVRRTDK